MPRQLQNVPMKTSWNSMDPYCWVLQCSYIGADDLRLREKGDGSKYSRHNSEPKILLVAQRPKSSFISPSSQVAGSKWRAGCGWACQCCHRVAQCSSIGCVWRFRVDAFCTQHWLSVSIDIGEEGGS